MNVNLIRMYAAACIALGIAGCDARKGREVDTLQQQWVRVQNDFEVIKLIDSGYGQKALTTYKRLAHHEVVGDQAILRYFSSGDTNSVRTLLNKMLDGWIIQEACHSQYPPFTVLLDSPDRLSFLVNLGTYREKHPNIPFDAEVDKTVAEILQEAQRRGSKKNTD